SISRPRPITRAVSLRANCPCPKRSPDRSPILCKSCRRSKPRLYRSHRRPAPDGVRAMNHSPFSRPAGRCTLVGAGPGDPDLLTIKALKSIQAASVLLVDDLVSDAIVAHAAPTARIVYVGKRGGCKS